MLAKLETSLPEACSHCGLPVARGRASRFCCAGCESVFGVLHANGLERYYELAAGFPRRAVPRRSVAAESFGYLDDPSFIAAYAEAAGSRMRFYLEGAHCAACVWLTERLPTIDAGVGRVDLDLSKGVATVDLLPGGSFERVADEFLSMGYRPHPVELKESSELRRRASRTQLLRLGVAAAGAGNLMLFSVALYAGASGGFAPLFRWLSLLVFLPVLFYSGAPFFKTAWTSLQNRRLSIDVPIAFGIVAGTAASLRALLTGTEEIYFDSLSGLIFLLLSSRYLLFRVQTRATDAGHLLHFLTPSRARLITPNGSVREVRTETLIPGDRVELAPGGIAAVDGVVESGGGEVTRSWLTGETKSERVGPGSSVLAGSRNEDQALVLRVVATGGKTRLGEILEETKRALSRRPAITEFVDRVSFYFVPATFALIGAGFLAGLSVGMEEAIERAVAVAIVVCPCALAMAVPLTMGLSIGRLARRGVLVRGGDVIERLARIDRVFFDKTGTLTTGEMAVIRWLPKRAGLESVLLGLECRSPHPIARAIREKFGDVFSPAEVTDVKEAPGVGISGIFDRHYYRLTRSERSQAGTEVTLFEDGDPVGTLRLEDAVRPNSAAAIRRLKELGLESEILSGDNRASVDRVARHLGIEAGAAHSGLTPEKKAERVRASPNCLFVGDGANDALALATAAAGMAVQGGMEVSMRAAGFHGASGDPLEVPRVIEVARETMRVIRRCLVFTAFYNAVVVTIALSGGMRPLVAAVLMPASALAVFAISMLGTGKLRRALREARR